MKVPPKRKGNLDERPAANSRVHASMKVPPKRKGNRRETEYFSGYLWASMKVPPKRKGNSCAASAPNPSELASMKVPPKRKGNSFPQVPRARHDGLNESPSEKEGKSCATFSWVQYITCLNESPSEKEGKCPVSDPSSAAIRLPQ